MKIITYTNNIYLSFPWFNHMNFMVKRFLLGAILCWVTSYGMHVSKDKTYWKNSYWVNLSGFEIER